MPRQIFAASALSRLLEAGAQLVDVLGREEYIHDHLPGALNIPLKQLDATAVAKLDQQRPVVVYCNDFG